MQVINPLVQHLKLSPGFRVVRRGRLSRAVHLDQLIELFAVAVAKQRFDTVTPMIQDSRVDQNNGFAHDNAVDTLPRQYIWTADDFPDGWAATSVAFQ